MSPRPRNSRRTPDFALEEAARRAGVSGAIVGVDEVGRGPLAGPVFACAVLLFERDAPNGLLAALRDSKALSRARREGLAPEIDRYGVVALDAATVAEIDRMNILQASLCAMARATAGLRDRLGAPPGLALVDGNRPPTLCCPAETVVKGDARSLSIAAASIFAKVSRDRHMAELATLYPGYGWERNAGYGVQEHTLGLQALGPTIHHRRTFKPVAKLLTPQDS